MPISKISSVTSTLLLDIIEDALFVLRENTIMAGLVTNYQGQGMSTRRVPIRNAATSLEVAEGVDFTASTESTKTQQASFTPHTEMVQYVLTDERMATDPENERAAAAREMGAALAEAVDVDLINLFSGFSVDKGPGAGNTATIADVAAAISVLRNRKVKEAINAVAHPYHWHDLWTELGQPGANQAFLGDTANQAMRDFFVFNWLGVAFFISANISIDGSTDAISGIFSRSAMALDTRRAPTFEPERDASLRAWELNLHMWYAVGELRDDHGVKYTADATEPS
jgi:hypothetical protein